MFFRVRIVLLTAVKQTLLVYRIVHSLDNRNTVLLVLLDLSAAFDTVDHRLLIDKLHNISIRAMHTAGYSLTFRSERKLLKSITSPQKILIYILVYRRTACCDPCFLQSTVWGSTMSSNSTNSVTTCMLTIPSCMLNFRVISQRMLQLSLTAYRDVPPM